MLPSPCRFDASGGGHGYRRINSRPAEEPCPKILPERPNAARRSQREASPEKVPAPLESQARHVCEIEGESPDNALGPMHRTCATTHTRIALWYLFGFPCGRFFLRRKEQQHSREFDFQLTYSVSSAALSVLRRIPLRSILGTPVLEFSCCLHGTYQR